MPRNKKHKEYTYKRLGVSGWDIHQWMDALWWKHGTDHRMYRHHRWEHIPYRFIKKYGSKQARLIVWTHIEVDYGIELF